MLSCFINRFSRRRLGVVVIIKQNLKVCKFEYFSKFESLLAPKPIMSQSNIMWAQFFSVPLPPRQGPNLKSCASIRSCC